MCDGDLIINWYSAECRTRNASNEYNESFKVILHIERNPYILCMSLTSVRKFLSVNYLMTWAVEHTTNCCFVPNIKFEKVCVICYWYQTIYTCQSNRRNLQTGIKFHDLVPCRTNLVSQLLENSRTFLRRTFMVPYVIY